MEKATVELGIKAELEKVCNQIANLPFLLNPSKEAKAREDELWNRKRQILAKLNLINK